MQHENNLRKNVFYREKKKKLVFKKPFSKRYIWKKGGSSYLRINTVYIYIYIYISAVKVNALITHKRKLILTAQIFLTRD